MQLLLGTTVGQREGEEVPWPLPFLYYVSLNFSGARIHVLGITQKCSWEKSRSSGRGRIRRGQARQSSLEGGWAVSCRDIWSVNSASLLWPWSKATRFFLPPISVFSSVKGDLLPPRHIQLSAKQSGVETVSQKMTAGVPLKWNHMEAGASWARCTETIKRVTWEVLASWLHPHCSALLEPFGVWNYEMPQGKKIKFPVRQTRSESDGEWPVNKQAIGP